jgi:hypothetical protein
LGAAPARKVAAVRRNSAGRITRLKCTFHCAMRPLRTSKP